VLISEEVGLQKDDTCVKLESDMAVCQNCGSPRSSDDQVSDGAHKLVFMMPSGDTKEVYVSDARMDCGTEEALDVGMEQFMQAAVGVEPLVVYLFADNNDPVENKVQLASDEQLVNEEEVVQHDSEANEE
jgi:hypothetical protein